MNTKSVRILVVLSIIASTLSGLFSLFIALILLLDLLQIPYSLFFAIISTAWFTFASYIHKFQSVIFAEENTAIQKLFSKALLTYCIIWLVAHITLISAIIISIMATSYIQSQQMLTFYV